LAWGDSAEADGGAEAGADGGAEVDGAAELVGAGVWLLLGGVAGKSEEAGGQAGNRPCNCFLAPSRSA
jgi:hypothetical protein